MHENWGSALTRKSWLKQRPIRELYWGLIENSDYRQRDGKSILKLYRDLGFNLAHTSQDASRWAACAQAGLVRVTTKTCHARYIGDFGVHERPDRYKKYRFAGSIWYPRRPKVLTNAHPRAVISLAGRTGNQVGRRICPFLCVRENIRMSSPIRTC